MNPHRRTITTSNGTRSPQYSVDRLCELIRDEEEWVTENWLIELLDYGVVVRDRDNGQQFSDTQLERARNAARIQRELHVNPPGIALALELRERIIGYETLLVELEFKAWSTDFDGSHFFH